MDEEMFEILYHRYFGKVYRFAMRHAREAQEAEDLVHDVFLKFWKNRHSFVAAIPPDAQLLVIAKHAVINRYRRELLRKDAAVFLVAQGQQDLNTADFLLRENEMSEELQKALAGLPPKRREIFEKSRFEVMTYEEIASDMGISKNTVESQMVKALKFLRERLAHVDLHL
ncbi:RNA polymerase sigma-70 factor [Ravibacter arvi]|uniref:RNA polymerase sigma-70 factor n=1 Tax=Ravibacter arvi TaxID=2051041 RepID=A0ABP8LTT6_9BACT